MKYIDLSKVTAEDVTGRWEVLNRVVGTGNEDSVFADVRLIEFKPDHYKSVNGEELVGVWTVHRENSIIYNPQLHFFINNHNIGNAIITRFYSEGDENNEISKLTLYFSNGLELLLQRSG